MKTIDGKNYKQYILRKSPYNEFPGDDDFWRAEEVFNLYGYGNGIIKNRSDFSLNRGSNKISIFFEDNDFDQGLKMYDYESRGL